MRVHPSQLVPGCMVLKDVMGQTNHPIIEKNTVIKPIHITVLHKFLIEEIDVGPKLASGEVFKPEEYIEEEESEEAKNTPVRGITSFADQYLDAVQAYKSMFKNWQAGSSIDISKVRKTIVPLIHEALKDKSQVFMLHHYSTKENYFYHHSIAVGLLSSIIAKQMNFSQGEIIQIGLTGFLSDAGMSKIEERIMKKRGPLTSREFEEVKKHPTYSYRLLEKIPVLKNEVRIGVLQHHERRDGSGYPIGIAEDKLHPYGKIVAVSDMYHAMTSERIYKTKKSPFKVIEEMMQDQFGKFDHKVVQAFIDSMTNFSTGTKVKLSNNQEGEIVFIEAKTPTRPMVRLFHNNEIIHLKNYRDLFIEEIVSNPS
ncbi:HD-GYP domain-containing protein [Pontibacillus marinus]|uniref:Phosphohydrolase n=1 Tax=Pontibacillus marinus BH030004 = DSM 16465 TaxID=1385511 RepID=A0A0A5G4J3_9BACI|nr:HD-GYP domain-containing protein [Pontibacillus marinus]KGX86974.1 phosphohydrolase [Pontibacillus marinus BH030004 = DSM 16465]